MAALFAETFYTNAIRPFIEARHEGLIVQNQWRRYDIPWADIKKVTPGYYGLVIERHDGPTVRAWAVQKSNWAAFRNWETRADRVAHEIARKARARGAHHSIRSMTPSARERVGLSRAARRVMITGFSLLVVWITIRIANGGY
jgi:hypothetical protein